VLSLRLFRRFRPFILCLLGWPFALLATGRADDLQTLDQRLIADILASKASQSTVNGYLSTLQANGSWTDVNYADHSRTVWNPQNHLTRLREMAKAYAEPTSALYQNASLKAGILSAYDYWIAANPQSDNWWYNQIGAPTSLADTMLLMQSDLSATQQSSGLTILTRSYQPRTTNSGTNTGENRVWRASVSICRGVLSGDAALTSESFLAIGDTIVTTTAEGIQRDRSFLQHGPQLYGGGYGMGYSNDVSRVAALGVNTAYTFSTAQQQLLTDFILDGQQWFVRGEAFDYTANGRGVTRPGTSTLARSLIAPVDDLLSLGTYRQAELTALKNRLATSKTTGQADPAQALVGNKHFWRGDFMAQQRAGYYTSVKISSTRTSQPESGNNEGLKNLHLADGVNMIMRTGNEYDDIFPVWDWRRLPGTTIEQGTYSLKPATDWGIAGTSTFAGGASDGMYGAVAFNYSRLNVAAKKSWFFFDNEYVALGAGINATAATAPVITTLNQTLQNGTVTYANTVGTTQTLTSGAVTMSDLRWVQHDGVGYLFPTTPGSATLQAVAQSGSWYAINNSYSPDTVTKNVFSLQVNHPNQPSNEKYSYIVVPGVDPTQMAAYAASNPIQIVRNDATVQAVQNSTLGLVQAAFYTGDRLNVGPESDYWFTPNAGAVLLVKRSATGVTISAANPAAAALSLQIQTGLNLLGYWNATNGYSTVTFSLPGSDLAGSTVTQFFAFSPNTAYWDLDPNTTGLQTGSGTWTNSVTTLNWAAGTDGANVAPWVANSAATFSGNGPAVITVADTIDTGGISITGTGYTFTGGTLRIGAAGMSSSAAANVASNVVLTGSQTWTSSTAGQTLTVSGSVDLGSLGLTSAGTGDVTISGVLSGTGAANLTKTGTGKLTLTAANTFGGTTTLSAGTLSLAGGDNRLPQTTTVDFTGTSTLDVGSTNQTVARLTFPTATSLTTTITGTGSLTVNGANDLELGPGSVSLGTNPLVTVSLSGLSNFAYNAASKTFRVGLRAGSGNTVALGNVATVTLATNNQITAASIRVGDVSANSDGGTSILHLGQTNVLKTDLINVGYSGRSDATLDFAAGLTNPTVTLSNAAGTGPIPNFQIGNIATYANATQSTFAATVDWSSGTVNGAVTNLIVGTANSSGTTARGGTENATFKMGAGTLAVGTLTIGRISGSTAIGQNYAANGTVTLNNAGGLLAATTVNFAENTFTGTGSFTKTVKGTFNLTAGTLQATAIQRGVQTGIATPTVVFNWANGTIQNTPGSDLAIADVPLTLTAGTHTFNATGSNTISLSATAPLSGTGGIVKSGTGTLVSVAVNTYSGDTVVNSGTLQMNALTNGGNTTVAADAQLSATQITQGTLSIQGTAANQSTQVTVRSSGTTPAGSSSGTSRVTNLSIANDGAALPVGPPSGALVGAVRTYFGSLDLTNNDLIIDNPTNSLTLLGDVADMIRGGQNGTGALTWNGRGLTSSVAATGPLAGAVGLGVIRNDTNPQTAASDTTWTTFSGVSGLVGNEILVKFTYYGDFNLDGSVTPLDFALLDAGLAGTVQAGLNQPGWYYGDANYDGVVNSFDTALANAGYWANVQNNAALPEPSGFFLAIFGVATIVLFARLKQIRSSFVFLCCRSSAVRSSD